MSAERGREFLDRRIIPDDLDWESYAQEPHATKVRPASSFGDEVIEAFFGDESRAGARWPWEKFDRAGLRFREGELTIYAGINGHFKSMITGQICLSLMNQGERCLIASMEMMPHKTLKRMVRQSSGVELPSMQYVKDWNAWSDGKLWLFDHLGAIVERKMLAVMRYAATELGIRQFFVDSLMRCVAATDDYTGQKLFIDRLQGFAKEFRAHVHLVAHAKKQPDEGDRLGKGSVKGATEIMDLTDNGCLIQRNKSNERNDSNGYGLIDGNVPGLWFEVVKQRDGAFEGTLGLWLDQESLAFAEEPMGRWPKITVEKF